MFRVPGKGAVGWVFVNAGDKPAAARRGEAEVTVPPGRAGYLRTSDDGTLLLRDVF